MRERGRRKRGTMKDEEVLAGKEDKMESIIPGADEKKEVET